MRQMKNLWLAFALFVGSGSALFGNGGAWQAGIPATGNASASKNDRHTDVTLEKNFAFTERVKLDVRGEFYNLLNHAIFNVPGFTLGAADFGVVSSARSPRTAQLALRVSF